MSGLRILVPVKRVIDYAVSRLILTTPVEACDSAFGVNCSRLRIATLGMIGHVPLWF